MELNASKHSWNLAPLLDNDDDPKAEEKIEGVKTANSLFVKKWEDRNDYLKDPRILKQALDEYESLLKNYGSYGDAGYYFSLRFCQDQTNPEIKARQNKIEEIEKQMQNKRKFFTLNITKIPKEKQKQFLQSNDLKEYIHFIERKFEEAKHVLTEPEEKILNLKEPLSHDYWEKMTSGLITKQEKEIEIDGEKQNKNFSEILSLTENKDENIRMSASRALNEIFSHYSEIAEAEINAILANHKINDELRNFPRPDSCRHFADDIETETVDTLIKTISEKFSVSQRFYKLKAKLLNLPKIKYAERNIPYGEINKEYPYEVAINLTHTAFSRLDKKFSQILESFLKNGQIDVFPKKGKKSGAFCIDYLPVQPCYILLNHTGTLKDVTTLAHEMGHAINHEMMKEKQNTLNIGWPKSTAEVASTFMEDFVLEELLKETNEEERLIILMEKLNSDISSIFRQTAFYNFETELHNKFRESGYLSKEEIGNIFARHMKSYMGESVDISESNNWWIYIPHFRYIFYVYSYASGLLISKSLQRKIKENKNSIEKIKEFLSAGTSDSPENILKKLGVDITKKEFWTHGLEEVESLINETEGIAKRLNKI